MTKTRKTNTRRRVNKAGRIDAARLSLNSSQWARGEIMDESEEAVIDLLTDLRHYCEAKQFDFEELDGIANAHYLIEY